MVGYYPPMMRWFDMRAYPIKDGLSVYFLDDTNRRNAEEELIRHRDNLEELVNQRTREVEDKAAKLNAALTREKEYNALQKKFVSLVSHEFRTPLSAFNVYSAHCAAKCCILLTKSLTSGSDFPTAPV